MDDQTRPGGMPTSPMSGAGGASGSIGPMGSMPPPPPPPPARGPMGAEDPHEKIMAALTRIEEKVTRIAAKFGA